MKLQIKIIKTVPEYAEEEVNKFLATLDPKDIKRIKYLCHHDGTDHQIMIIIEYIVWN